MAAAIEEIRKLRIEKIKKLRDLGVNPYPAKFSKQHTPILEAREKLDQEVTVVGRLKAIRAHGEIIFADLCDLSSKIQLLFQFKNLKNKKEILDLVDSGDFLGIVGKVIKTQAGEEIGRAHV